MTSQRRQTIAHHAHGGLRLAGLIPSPYTAELNGIGPVRDTSLFPDFMKVFVYSGSPTASNYRVVATFMSGATLLGNRVLDLSGLDFDSIDFPATLLSKAQAMATTEGWGTVNAADMRDGTNPMAVISALLNAPQAAVADSPADATTNYNVVTTLLGSLTGAVNTANTKQNAIAVQLNSLLADLRNLGLITP